MGGWVEMQHMLRAAGRHWLLVRQPASGYSASASIMRSAAGAACPAAQQACSIQRGHTWRLAWPGAGCCCSSPALRWG